MRAIEFLQESLTPPNKFLSKAEKLKAGNKVFYKGKLVGIATGEINGDRVIFKPFASYGNSGNFASLPIDQISLREGKHVQGVAEGFPQPGPSSGAPQQFGSDAKIQTRQMTVKDIISSIPGVPYYNNVVDDWDAKDYSWNTTEKVIEYATYLKDHPESLAKLPPIIVLNGKFEDGAHRVSAIWLLQQRMDPKNPLWKNAKLNVQFVKQGMAEDN